MQLPLKLSFIDQFNCENGLKFLQVSAQIINYFRYFNSSVIYSWIYLFEYETDT